MHTSAYVAGIRQHASYVNRFLAIHAVPEDLGAGLAATGSGVGAAASGCLVHWLLDCIAPVDDATHIAYS
jgi:hypothetical protein